MTTPFSSVCRVTLACAAVLVLASACGGTSFSSGDGDGGDSGSNSGGSGNEAGTRPTAGKSNGGTSSGGAASGGTASGGTGTAGSSVGGHPGGDACTAPAASGNCDAYFERWYHDVTTGLCRPFVYGGCGGNENNYETFEQCQKACRGGAPNYDACQAPTDCMVTSVGCCGVCDGPGLTRRDLTAYNKKFQGQVLGCGAGDIACAPCAPPLPGEGSLVYFVPNCVQGECVVEDIRTSPVTACMDATECRLRNGTACCEGCGTGDVVAVRNDGSLEDLVCGDGPTACPACVPLPPEGAVAVCTQGHCEVAYLAGATKP